MYLRSSLTSVSSLLIRFAACIIWFRPVVTDQIRQDDYELAFVIGNCKNDQECFFCTDPVLNKLKFSHITCRDHLDKIECISIFVKLSFSHLLSFCITHLWFYFFLIFLFVFVFVLFVFRVFDFDLSWFKRFRVCINDLIPYLKEMKRNFH